MKRILFQGDSITDAGRNRNDFYGMGIGYPHLVAGTLGFENLGEYEFINRGISGNRSIDLLARVKADFIALKPDYMSILIGVNDVWHDIAEVPNGVDVEKYEFYYDLLIKQVNEALPELKIMILEPFVLKCVATEENWETFDREVKLRAAAARRIAEKYGLLFVSLQEKFDEAAKTAGAAALTGDGVHPNVKGHELIKREWIKAFESIK